MDRRMHTNRNLTSIFAKISASKNSNLFAYLYFTNSLQCYISQIQVCISTQEKKDKKLYT